jgi:hypothetical protein
MSFNIFTGDSMRSIVIATLLISSTAFACPDLAGTYAVCRSQTGASSGSTDMVITQQNLGSAAIYTVTSTDSETNVRQENSMNADGKLISASSTDPQSGMTFKFDTMVSCNSNKSVNVDMKIFVNGSQAASVTSDISKAGKTLTIKSHAVGPEGETSDVVICD